MVRFKIGDSPRNTVPLGGSTLKGGTWYTPEMIGMTEKALKEYPMVVWEGKEAKKEEKVVKVTEEELQAKADKLGFTKFRKWANNKFKVTGRKVEGIIADILAGKTEL